MYCHKTIVPHFNIVVTLGNLWPLYFSIFRTVQITDICVQTPSSPQLYLVQIFYKFWTKYKCFSDITKGPFHGHICCVAINCWLKAFFAEMFLFVFQISQLKPFSLQTRLLQTNQSPQNYHCQQNNTSAIHTETSARRNRSD